MKILLMTDMEGVAGIINSDDWVLPGARYFEEGKRLLTMEVNAAVEGFFDAGADEIVVCDGHGYSGVNLELLDNRVLYQRGWDGPYPFGNDETFDVMVWVGQHPKAGTEYGHICHTGNLIDRKINGVSVGEFGEEVAICVGLGVQVIFASGCLAFTKEAEALVPGIQTVAVKFGVTPGSGDECTHEEYMDRNLGAVHLHPEKARKLIKKGAYDALKRFITNPETFGMPVFEPPFELECIVRKTGGVEGYTIVTTNPTSVPDLLNGKGETKTKEVKQNI